MTSPAALAGFAPRVHVPVATWYTPAFLIGAVIGTRRDFEFPCADATAQRSASGRRLAVCRSMLTLREDLDEARSKRVPLPQEIRDANEDASPAGTTITGSGRASGFVALRRNGFAPVGNSGDGDIERDRNPAARSRAAGPAACDDVLAVLPFLLFALVVHRR